MRILIAYATYSSGTQTVSELVQHVLEKHGWDVVRENIKNVHIDSLSTYDLILFGSPSWLNNKKDGQPHQFFLTFMEHTPEHAFSGKKMAIFGLGDTAYPNFCGAVHELEEFVTAKEGTLVTESLRIDGYYFDEEMNNEKVKLWASQLVNIPFH